MMHTATLSEMAYTFLASVLTGQVPRLPPLSMGNWWCQRYQVSGGLSTKIPAGRQSGVRASARRPHNRPPMPLRKWNGPGQRRF